MTMIDRLAGEYARLAVRNIGTEFPHATHHVVRGAGDPSRPRDLHPAFHGSFDWHSCVHMHWLLVRLLGGHAARIDADAVRATLDRTLTPTAIAAEAAYLRDNPGFERPYGWAWAAALSAACDACPDPAAAAWSAALRPLADTVAELVTRWLRLAVAPVRHGVHTNTAFALGLLHDAAAAQGRDAMRGAIEQAAHRWFGADRDYPAAWEPSGQDFLSPALAEADLMRRVLPAVDFARWLDGFLPGLAEGEPAALFTPAEVADPDDGYQVHLYGLNLSRAWQFRVLAAALPGTDPRPGTLRAAAERHLAAALPRVAGGGFAADHWLATYAYLALTA
jgi:hypothetical protein